MNLAAAALSFLVALVLILVGVTRFGAWLIERRNPPTGAFAEIGAASIHHVHLKPAGEVDLPPLVFIHGASGNLRDQMLPMRPLLEGRAEILFLDRPGHGWSTRGSKNETPAAQARTIASLMDRLGIGPAIIVGHSFGGAVTAALALERPDKVAGLVFLAAATHPWPGADTSWYYELAARPLIGRLFVNTLAWPGGRLRMKLATECVVAPNRAPETYATDAGIDLVLRPGAFRANSIDVAGLYRHVVAIAPRYGEIAVPTVVVSGDRDTVVYEEVHSTGLARDIPGAEMVWVRNLGHKPDWIAPDLVVAAIEKVAGRDLDLAAAAAAVEARIRDDAWGIEHCVDEKPPLQGQAAPAG